MNTETIPPELTSDRLTCPHCGPQNSEMIYTEWGEYHVWLCSECEFEGWQKKEDSQCS